MIFRLLVTVFVMIFGYSGAFIAPDYIVCIDKQSCVHEIGHWLDQSLDYPSQTTEFKSEIDNNLPSIISNTTCIIKTEKCLYSEAYAKLYEAVEGNINKLPPNLKIFYKEVDYGI